MKNCVLMMFCANLCLQSVYGGNVSSSDFSFTIESLRDGSVRRSIPIKLTVVYKGKEEIRATSIYDVRVLDMSFDTPPEWVSSPRPKITEWSGVLPIATLRENTSMTGRFDLQDYFNVITPGKVDLGISIHIWSSAFIESDNQSIVLHAIVPIELWDEDNESLQKYIETVSVQFDKEENASKRRAYIDDLLGVSHPDVIPVLLKGLSDPCIGSLHPKLRRKVLALSTIPESKEMIVEYLVKNGGKYDSYFFSTWKATKASFTQEERNALSSASNPWIKLYALEMFPDVDGRKGKLASLEAEIEDMGAYFKKHLTSVKESTDEP